MPSTPTTSLWLDLVRWTVSCCVLDTSMDGESLGPLFQSLITITEQNFQCLIWVSLLQFLSAASPLTTVYIQEESCSIKKLKTAMRFPHYTSPNWTISALCQAHFICQILLHLDHLGQESLSGTHFNLSTSFPCIWESKTENRRITDVEIKFSTSHTDTIKIYQTVYQTENLWKKCQIGKQRN